MKRKTEKDLLMFFRIRYHVPHGLHHQDLGGKKGGVISD